METETTFEYCVVFFNSQNVVTQIDGKPPAKNTTMSDMGALGWDVVQVIPLFSANGWCAALMKVTSTR